MAAVLLAGCTPDAGPDPFTASGELVALSGGDAGPQGACFTCHGLRGEGDGQSVPRLAGVPAGHLQKQLEDYAAKLRPDPVMSPIARALDPADRRSVAEHYARLPAIPRRSRATVDGAVRSLYHRGDAARGITPCASCHGAAGEGLGAANPPVAGQPPPYLADQLRRWRAARRRNDPRGVMLHVSRRLTDVEVVGLAAYAAGLSGSAAPAAPPPEAFPPTRRADAARGAAPWPPREAAGGR